MTNRSRTTTCLFSLVLLLLPAFAHAADREDVIFSVNQTTVVGQSVFVLGDIEELGGNDVRKAVKLEPSTYPVWKATVSLPKGTTYTYQYYLRSDAPADIKFASNGTPIGTPVTTSTSPLDPPAHPFDKQRAILAHLDGYDQPSVFWRRADSTDPFAEVPMIEVGEGRTTTEKRYIAWNVSDARRPIDFYFQDADGSPRFPAASAIETELPALFFQDGDLFTYIPAPAVSPARRDYTPASPPTLFSTQLGQTRTYRVFLPRGYDEHTHRTYPVLYMHDGQNIFETGPFGSWNIDDTLPPLIDSALVAEVIVVGIDNTSTRLQDYAAPDAGGRADDYVAFLKDTLKPVIDANYRTMPDAANTGAAGSSMGGQVSLYMGWDFPDTYTRIGAFSGAWQVFTSGFYNRVRAQPKRDIRVYLDSGDSGTANDNYWVTINLRDNFLARDGSPAEGDPYILHDDMINVVGFNQQHNEAAWASRFPASMQFLFPGDEAENDLVAIAEGTAFDRNQDGVVNAEDLYTQSDSPADIDNDTSVTQADTALLEAFLRLSESADLPGQRR